MRKGIKNGNIYKTNAEVAEINSPQLRKKQLRKKL